MRYRQDFMGCRWRKRI